MPDLHSMLRFPSMCSEETIECTRTTQSETELDFQDGRLGRPNSLEFAENLISRSKESFHNPTKSLHMLTLGLEAMKRTSEVSAAALLQCFYMYVALCNLALNTAKCLDPLQEGHSEKERAHDKKVPKEHSYEGYITSTDVRSNQFEEDTNCCDAEGDTKSSNKGEKTGQGTQHSSRTSGGIQRGSPLSFHGADSRGSRGRGGGGDDDDDDDENKPRRKVIGSKCNGNIPNADDDDEKSECDPVPDDDDDMPSSTSKHDPVTEDDDMPVGDVHQDGEMVENKPVNSDDDMTSTKEHAIVDDVLQKNERPNDDDDDNDVQSPSTAGKSDLVDYNPQEESSTRMLTKGDSNMTSDNNNDGDNDDGGDDDDGSDDGGDDDNSDDDDNDDDDVVALVDYNPQEESSARMLIKGDSNMTSNNNNDGNDDGGGNDDNNDDDDDDDDDHSHQPITQEEIENLIQDIQSSVNADARSHGMQQFPFMTDDQGRLSVGRVVSRGAPASDHGEINICQENNVERPQTSVLHPFCKGVLSVQGGRYDEDFEWRKVKEDEEDRAYLGQGSSGKCYLCIDLKTTKLFAIKKIPISKFNLSEIKVWSKVSGENVRSLDLYGAVQVDNVVTVLMEYMEGGSIGQLLCDPDYEGGLNETSSLYILREVLEGLAFLHSKGIVHCDVKGENIFVDQTLTKVKLGDYGAARQLSMLDYDQVPTGGTEQFMSPEACRSEQVTYSWDIWAAACLEVQMLTGEPPWSNFPGSVIWKVGNLLETPPLPECSPAIRNLLTRMFAINASDRPSARELLRDPIFAEVIWQPYGNDEEILEDSDSDSDDENIDPVDDHQPHVPLSIREVNNQVISEEDDQSATYGIPEVNDELQQLQSDLFFSLSLSEVTYAGAVMMNEIDTETIDEEVEVTTEVNQELLLQVQEDDNGRSFGRSYSIKDLTKVTFYNTDNELLVEIRDKSCCTFGHLAKNLHDVFKNKDARLREGFTFETTVNTAIDVESTIGFSHLRILVHPATEENWEENWSWRINHQGTVQLRPA